MRCVIPKQSHFVYPAGKPIIPHLRRYQGFAVEYYSVTLDALYLGYPRLSLNRGKMIGGGRTPTMLYRECCVEVLD